MQPVITYRGAFTFDDEPETVWAAIGHTEWFEGWWPWLHEFVLDGDGIAAGSVLHGVVRPPVPYAMRVDVELVDCDRPRSIDAVVRGDLEGTATLRLHARQPGTRADVAWTIEMMQRPMRVASKVAFPVLRMGHDAVVHMTVAGFRRHLRRARSGRGR